MSAMATPNGESAAVERLAEFLYREFFGTTSRPVKPWSEVVAMPTADQDWHIAYSYRAKAARYAAVLSGRPTDG